MAGGSTAAGDSISPTVAYIYIFNLIVGVGALALPIGFKAAGLILGIIFLAVIGFLAFITVTWINEVQATGNAVLTLREKGIRVDPGYSAKDSSWRAYDTNERTGLLPPSHDALSINENDGAKTANLEIFRIKRRIELGMLSELFLGAVGQKIFYAILIIYLYGDLAIYAVTVPKSLSNVTQGFHIGHHYISEHHAYYLFLGIFTVCIIPFTFFNFQKTKYLQLFTITTRNVALFTMIILAITFLSEGNGTKVKDVHFFDITGLPKLFGVSIYAFMCHHSLPSLVSPIKNKSKLTTLFAGDFITIFIVYSILCATALFAFGDIPYDKCDPRPGHPCTIQQLYTLNFSSFNIRPIAIFLTLFPVFTLSTNFPLIAITLRNNLMELIPFAAERHRLRMVIFSLVAVVPPIIVAFCTRDVDVLVNVTGSYAGLGIMFIIPALLVLYSRRKIDSIDPTLVNPHRSPFGHRVWIFIILIASALCIGLITFNHIYGWAHPHKSNS